MSTSASTAFATLVLRFCVSVEYHTVQYRYGTVRFGTVTVFDVACPKICPNATHAKRNIPVWMPVGLAIKKFLKESGTVPYRTVPNWNVLVL